jgi:hypothetical protein
MNPARSLSPRLDHHGRGGPPQLEQKSLRQGGKARILLYTTSQSQWGLVRGDI